jgi:DNA-binding NtrC family response regulator/tetratricopeptide (TPR) repeat protein
MHLLPQTPPTGDALLHTLRSLVLRGRHTEADRAAGASRSRLAGEQGTIFLALRAEIALGLGRFAAALEWAGEALKGIEPCPVLRRSLEASRMRALIGLSRFRDAQARIETIYAALDPDGSELSLFRGHVALHSGRLGAAAQLASEAATRAVSSRQRAKFVEALLLKARVAREVGQTVDARTDLARAERASNGLRDASVLASVLSDRADLMAHTGEWKDAGRAASQSGRIFARALSPHEHLSAGRRTGLLGLAQGDPNEALPAIERAAEVARRGYGTIECRAEIDLLLADAQLAGRDPEGALERATAALDFFRSAQNPGGLARAHVRRALAALQAKNVVLAFREARIAASIKGAGPVAEGLAAIALGQILLRREPGSASAAFGRALRNDSLYPPLRAVAALGMALSNGASPQSDEVQRNLARLEEFGDLRILAIVRSELRELPGFEAPPSSYPAVVALETSAGEEDGEAREFLPGLVGTSLPVRELGALVRRFAPTDLPVSIYGETGVGKENVARAIHELSPRAPRKCVAVNAASLSDELFESHLFGHVRGSFTGAQADRPGLVEEARGGTLFIDEVADLSPRSQISLLRFLQEGTYRRVGENLERRADVRMVVAANQPLEDLVAAGRFRQDLLYRLQGVCLTVPPLRDRGRDILRLARHFVARSSGGRRRLTCAAEAELLAHPWPGNVRELELEMKRAVVLADAETIEWARPKIAAAGARRPDPAAGSSAPVRLQEAVLGFERTLLKSVLAQCAERAEAARLLGISRQALHQKIVRYGLR